MAARAIMAEGEVGLRERNGRAGGSAWGLMIEEGRCWGLMGGGLFDCEVGPGPAGPRGLSSWAMMMGTGLRTAFPLPLGWARVGFAVAAGPARRCSREHFPFSSRAAGG